MTRRTARGACGAVIALLLLPATAMAGFGDRPLRTGMKGKDVKVLQTLLSKAGFKTTPDGVFGRGTRRSVVRWERIAARRINGWVSRRDAAALRREFQHDATEPDAVPELPELPILPDGVSKPTVTVRTQGTYLVRLGEGSLTAGASAVDAPEAFERRQHTFPLPGRHDLGRSESNSFGGGRGHQGQDMFAPCGTRIVAAQGGTVRFAGYHSAAGNYLVIRGAGSGEDYVYMHLQNAPTVAVGDRVKTGERVGAVGNSGRADGCHLHFELWSEPGWYSGGSAYDPLPKLRQWEQRS